MLSLLKYLLDFWNRMSPPGGNEIDSRHLCHFQAGSQIIHHHNVPFGQP